MAISSAKYTLGDGSVIVTYADGTVRIVPVDAGNADYQALLAWDAEGENDIAAADEAPPEYSLAEVLQAALLTKETLDEQDIADAQASLGAGP